MFDPVGPLPAAVYWRRRWATLGAAVFVVAIMSWSVSALVTASAELQTATQRAAQAAAEQAEPSAADRGFDTAADNSTPSALAAPGGPDGEGVRPVEPGVSAAPPPPVEPPCADQAVSVLAEIEKPEQKVGGRSPFRLVITNTGAVPCRRDLDAALQEMFVTTADGTKRLWSSNDCSPGKSVDQRLLAPGQRVDFTLSWTNRTSAPGCKAARQVVPAGNYVLRTRLGAVISPPVPFRLVR